MSLIFRKLSRKEMMKIYFFGKFPKRGSIKIFMNFDLKS